MDGFFKGRKLTSPSIFLLRMVIFLTITALVGVVLHKQIKTAFWANPALNALIGLVLVLGIVFALGQVMRLYREIRWVNGRVAPDLARPPPDMPELLAPVAALLGEKGNAYPISIPALRSMLDSMGGRLDETRELARYLTGLLVFLGLLGTFWGLIETIGAISGVIENLSAGSEGAVLFEQLKRQLAAPLSGMGVAFSSSLFGLAGSLILGFLDLQAGQAQSRFFYETEEWLSSITQDQGQNQGQDQANAFDPTNPATLSQSVGAGRASHQALQNLADGITAMIQHMRAEQQLIRSWVEAQAAEQAEMGRRIEKLVREHGNRAPKGE